MRAPEPPAEGPGRYPQIRRSQLLLTLPRGGGFARDLMGHPLSAHDREGNPTPTSGSGDSLAPRFSSAVRDDVSDAVYTNTGVMGLVRAPTRMYLGPGQAGTPGPSLSGANRTSWLFDSLERPDGPGANRSNRSVSGEPDRMPEPSLALEALALYLPELVLRQFAQGKVRPLPHAERVRGALLFADITGFTQLTQQLQASELGPARGAEELNKILSDYFDLLIRCFHAHGGDVVSFSGDAMTVLFEAVEGDGPTAASPGTSADAIAPPETAAERGSKAGDGPRDAVAEAGGSSGKHVRHGSTSASPPGMLEHQAVIVEESSVRESAISREPSSCSARISVEKSNSPAVAGRISVEHSGLSVEHAGLSVEKSSSSAVRGSPGRGTPTGLFGSILRTSSNNRILRHASTGGGGCGAISGTASRRSPEGVDARPAADGRDIPEGGAGSSAAPSAGGAAPAVAPGLPLGIAHFEADEGTEQHEGPLAGLASFFGFGGARRPSPTHPADASSPRDPGTSRSMSVRPPTPAKQSRPHSPRRSAPPQPVGEDTPPDSSGGPRWLPAAVAGGDAKRAALVRASLRAAQCALDVLEQVDSFSLARYSQYGVAEISLHASMGAGELVGIYVTGEPASPPAATSPHDGAVAAGGCGDSVPGTAGSLRPDRPRARNAERRDGFALMGTPMRQLREAERRAKTRECVLSPEAWSLLAPHADAQVDADGFAKLRSLRKAGHNRAWREADAERAVSLGRQRELALFFVERSVDAATRLAAYVPEPVQYRLRTAGMNWLADFRLASILFVRVLSLSHECKDEHVDTMVAKTQQVFGAIRAEIVRFEGMLARFNVDDKGTILFAAFGPPPYQHEDDAVRAVLCALQVSAVLGSMGHVVRVGVTTGTVFAGSVGNAERGEYTFYGETVNMAARLMTSDSNESVLVDEHTMRDSSHEVRFESLPPLRVKGWMHPVSTFKPTERRGLLGGAPRGRGAAAQTRQGERARLHLMLSTLAHDGRGGLLMVQGEAGMGKTSLLREAERMAVGMNTTVLKGSCSAIDEGTPLHVFGFVMRQLLDGLSIGQTLGGSRRGLAQSLATADTSRRNRRGSDESSRLPDDSPLSPGRGGRLPGGPSSGISARRSTGAPRAEMLATLGTASEGRALSVRSLLDNGSAEVWRHVPLLSGLLGLGIGDTPYTANLRGEKRRDKLLALCVQLIRAKAAQHHTLVLLDNVQWMDAKSWELLLKVKHELPNILVICAMRTPPAAGTSGTGLAPDQAASPPVVVVRRRSSRGTSRAAASAIESSPLVRGRNTAEASNSSTAQLDSPQGGGSDPPTRGSSSASPSLRRALTTRASVSLLADGDMPRPPTKARSISPPLRPRSTSPPARFAAEAVAAVAAAAVAAAASGVAASILPRRPSGDVTSPDARSSAADAPDAARQPLKMFGGRSVSPSDPGRGSPGPAGRTILLSTAERKLKTSQMAVLTTLEEEERMRLGPLQEADLAFMALEMLGVETLPDELAAFLLRKSEGNPLYCHEIMSFLLRQRLLLPATIVDGKPTPLPQPAEPEGGAEASEHKPPQSGGGLAAAALGAAGRPVQTVLLSPGASLSSLESAFAAEGSVAGNSHALQRLLTAQVDALPHEQQAVLKTACAMGVALTSKSLRDVHASLAIQPTGSRLDDALRRLRHARILEFALDTKTYSFRSAMLRDVVYSNLTFEQRQRVHEATAKALVAESERRDGHATAHLSALKHYKAAENWTQVMLLAADAARQALGCASWEEAVSVTTLAALVHRQHGQGVTLPPGTPTHWLVLRGEALLALGQRAEANVALGLAFDDGIARGSNAGRRAPSVKGGSVPRRLSAVLGLFRKPPDRRGSIDSAAPSPPAEPKRRHTEGSASRAPPRAPTGRGAGSASLGEARRRSSEELGSGGCTLLCAAEVQHALRAFAMLFFGQLETAAESDADAAAAVVNATPISSRLPLALTAAALLPDGSERMLGFACALIAAGLSARQATPGRGSAGVPLSRSKLTALHEAIEYFVDMSPVATKLSRSLGEALSSSAHSGPPLLASRSTEAFSIEMCSPSFLAMLCLALGLSPVPDEPTAALWFRRASALALEAEHAQLHRTICMLSVDVPLSATL